MVGWGLVLILGYVCPAYECIKTVEMNEPDIEQLLFWCQYWILVVGLTVCETIVHKFIACVPMLGEAKFAFFIYLWFHKTKGYESFFRPYVSKHQIMIDHFLLKVTTRAGGSALFYWKKAASYGQTRIEEILQYFGSQSTLPSPAQQRPTDGQCSAPSKVFKMLKNYLSNCQSMMADQNGIARRTVWFFLATCSWVFVASLQKTKKRQILETNKS